MRVSVASRCNCKIARPFGKAQALYRQCVYAIAKIAVVNVPQKMLPALRERERELARLGAGAIPILHVA